MWLYHAMPDDPWASLAYRHVMAPGENTSYVRALVAQFLWDRPYLPCPDFKTVPRVKWFPDGGVFMRTGWTAQDSVFWLKTQQYRYNTGNHNDYGSFYLHAYGEPFAVEAGAKHVASAMHNVVFIDGQGLDHGSSDVMPATPLLDLVDGAFASAALIDEKEAYSDDIYFEGDDRHLVTKPLNPMQKAQRIGCMVWGGEHTGSYLLIANDLEKDGQQHKYSWRMMLNPNHKTAPRADGTTLLRDKAAAEPFNPPQLDCAMLSPLGKPVLVETKELLGKENTTIRRLVADVTAANPHFTVCLYPRQDGQPGAPGMPGLSSRRVTVEGGHAAVLSWPECTDRVVVSYGSAIEVKGVSTDAKLLVLRTATQPRNPQAAYGPVVGFVMVGGTFLTADGASLVKTDGRPCSVAATVPTGQVVVGMTTQGTVTVTGFKVKQVSRYNGNAGGASPSFRRIAGQTLGVAIELAQFPSK